MEFLIILLLLVLNGIFAMYEIALVSSSKARLETLFLCHRAFFVLYSDDSVQQAGGDTEKPDERIGDFRQ